MEKPISRTGPALLNELTARDPTHDFMIDGVRTWSYRSFGLDVDQCARALLANGIVRGDRVGILAGNRAEWLIVNFAAMSIGAITVGLNTWSSAQELAYQLDHAEAKILFVEPVFRERDFVALVAAAHKHDGKLDHLERVIALGDGEAGLWVPYVEFLSSGNDVGATDLAAATAAVHPEDVACLLYTSGSTALPKGVPLLHRGLIENMWEIGERQHLVTDDRLWLAVSLFWSLACVNALFAVFTHRATIVLQHHFDAGEALRLIEAERCTVFYGTPNMALAMLEHPTFAKLKLQTLRTGVTIGTAKQVQRIADFGVSGICNVYGLTEAYGNSTVTDALLPLEQRLETVGQALPGTKVRIIDPDTWAEQPVGTQGEITLLGNLTPGYWNDPVRTAEAFNEDGWFRTGDLGMVDSEGYLFYRGRLKEMVKTGGINAAPAEVEQVLTAHPAIELAFVTGIPHDRLDEALAAVIVLRRDATTDEAELKTHCRAALATYKTPRHFRFIEAEEFPLTTTGKLQRNRLAELFN